MTKMSEYKVVFVVYATIHDIDMILTTRDASCIVEQHMHMVDIH